MLSGLLNCSLAQFISQVNFKDPADLKQVQIEREIDGGIEKLTVPLPAILTTDLRLNEPRYASYVSLWGFLLINLDLLRCSPLTRCNHTK
jgi:electron transfer flavoprotein beta subunit